MRCPCCGGDCIASNSMGYREWICIAQNDCVWTEDEPECPGKHERLMIKVSEMETEET